MSDLVERLAEKWAIECVDQNRESTPRWWLNAIADELDAAEGLTANVRGWSEIELGKTITSWLRSQATDKPV